jgi:putative tricarboxylic transport membrane protein
MLGLFVLGEIFVTMTNPPPAVKEIAKFRQSFLTKAEVWQSIPNFLRSSIIGGLVGLMPGIGGSFVNILAYDQAKKASKEPETFGKGNIQGLIAPETASNAAIGGSLVPTLTLGIPGDAVTAVLMGGLLLHGIDPGPLMFRDHPLMVNMIYINFFLASVMMFLSMVILGARLFPLILRLPMRYIIPFVLVACTAGTYNMNTSMADVWTALAFGVIGYFFKRFDIPPAPAVIGLILGKMLEENLRRTLIDTEGSLFPFLTSPVAVTFLLMATASVAYSIWQKRTKSA